MLPNSRQFPELSAYYESYISDMNKYDDCSNPVVNSDGYKPKIKVVNKTNDESRGFRLFDGALFSIKDVSSEELFLDRIKIAYSAFEKYVEPTLLKSPVQITRALLTALGACIVRYFSKRSVNNSHKPVITEIINLNSPLMFCTTSDFCRSYLYTKTTDNDNMLDRALNVFGTDTASSTVDITAANTQYNNIPDEWKECRELWSKSSKILSSLVEGGVNTDLGQDDGDYYTSTDSNKRREVEALLFLLCDFETLHNYLSYIIYMTPNDLNRRYNVQFDCLKRFKSSNETIVNASTACCIERAEQKTNDLTKSALSSYILQKSSEKKTNDIANQEEEVVYDDSIRIENIVERNTDLVKNLLLMLFDKNVSYLLDNGFDNLNRRRNYSNISKEIGSSTIYTGIIDTVGQVATRFMDNSFVIGNRGADSMAKVGENKPKEIKIVLPLP